MAIQLRSLDPRSASDESRSQIRQANEVLILAAAEKVFARAGFGGATMAAIAEESGLPKANLHYYFGSKRELYRGVLARILRDWLAPMHGIVREADPREALGNYIREKMRMSWERPDASRVFANELLHGALEVRQLLAGPLREQVREKAAVVESWIREGRMAPVDSSHLFFTVWSATQTYADFDVQVCAVLGCKKFTTADRERATAHVVSMLLRGCGLE